MTDDETAQQLWQVVEDAFVRYSKEIVAYRNEPPEKKRPAHEEMVACAKEWLAACRAGDVSYAFPLEAMLTAGVSHNEVGTSTAEIAELLRKARGE